MVKWLLVIGLFVLVVLLMNKASRRREVPQQSAAEPNVEDMVRCHVCGVNLPRSEAILSRGRFYCGEEHCRRNGD